jgi:hypothetical protein
VTLKFEGDVLQITSIRNTPYPALEKARGIRLYDGNKKLFDGYLRAPDYRRGSNKYRTLTTGVYDWRKELMPITAKKYEPEYRPSAYRFQYHDIILCENYFLR